MENLDLKWAIDDLAKRQAAYTRAANYYKGEHDLAFATDKWRNAFGTVFRQFKMNLCPAVVQALTNRLALNGVQSDDDRVAEAVAAVWRTSRLDERSDDAHLQAVKLGDSYLIVWPNAAGTPIIHPNGGNLVTVRYDEEEPGLIVLAAKSWVRADKKKRVNLYYPDRVEKWIDDRGWKAFDETVPNPYGRVPVFHIRNDGEMGGFGVSELEAALPIQDALNKTVMDLLIANERQSYRQRYAVGIEVELDEKGKPVNPFKAGPENLWTTPNPDAKFGELEAGDPARLLAVKDGFILDMARVTRTPMHHFLLGGSFPSGEALKTAEAPLTSKVNNRQKVFGNAWEDAFQFALGILGFDDTALDAVWANTEPRSESDFYMGLETKARLGVSRRQLLAEIGYSPDRIAAIEAERAEEDNRAANAFVE